MIIYIVKLFCKSFDVCVSITVSENTLTEDKLVYRLISARDITLRFSTTHTLAFVVTHQHRKPHKMAL